MPRGAWFTAGFFAAFVVITVLLMGPLAGSRAGQPPIQPVATPVPTATPLLPTPEPTAAPLDVYLRWQRQGGGGNACDILEIDRRHQVHYAPCDSGPRLAYLTTAEHDAYLLYLARYAPFEYAIQTGHDGLTPVTVRLIFDGQGSRRATSEEQAEVAHWIGQVYDRLLGEEERADMIAQARLHLAGKAVTPVDNIVTERITFVTWPDACLGIVAEDLYCAQVYTPGYEIILRHDGRTYAYRTDLHGQVRAVGDQQTRPPIEAGQ